MNFNIFRNPFIDTQVSMLMDTFDDALRKQTEQYWRSKIAGEILTAFPYMANIQIIAEKIRKND
jgi:hypothetical protein